MKEYPKILGISENNLEFNKDCIGFVKIDGSSLRFCWNRKQGWYKFGTRHRLFDKNDPEYGCAIDLFIAKYGEAIEKVMKDKYKKSESVIAFAEFIGPYSFAGKHDSTWLSQAGLLPEGQDNTPKDVVLFDVNPHKQGLISPYEFVELFSHVHIPAVIYQGKLTEEFIQDVRNGVYPVVEGCVVKGSSGHNLWMRKIKTFAYLKKIRELFGTGWEVYGE